MPGHAPFPPFLLPSLPSSGGLVLGLTLSASARDLHEVLHEELVECAFVNHLHPWGKEGGREGGEGEQVWIKADKRNFHHSSSSLKGEGGRDREWAGMRVESITESVAHLA